MIIVMQRQADETAIQNVIAFIHERGLHEHVSRGEERTIIGAVGDERVFQPRELEALPGVEKAIRVLRDWRIISREAQAETSVITVRGVAFGNGQWQTIKNFLGKRLPESAAVFIDPFYRPESPYSPIQQESDAVRTRTLNQQSDMTHQAGKPVLVRIRDVRQLAPVLHAEADILYLGGELMTNRTLQDEVGRLNVPVVLCKDKHHQVEEWLMAAEHIALKGNHHILLGEAGTLSLDRNAPYRLDIEAIVKVKKICHLPVLTNLLHLSHAYMSQAVLLALSQAAGADGAIVQTAS